MWEGNFRRGPPGRGDASKCERAPVGAEAKRADARAGD
jgi:hypothetical protein